MRLLSSSSSSYARDVKFLLRLRLYVFFLSDLLRVDDVFEIETGTRMGAILLRGLLNEKASVIVLVVEMARHRHTSPIEQAEKKLFFIIAVDVSIF